jgi:hypothetical protein
VNWEELVAELRTGQNDVVWPLGRVRGTTFATVPRLIDLTGKRVALLSDGVFQADVILPLIGQALARRFPGLTYVDPSVFGNYHRADEEGVLAKVPQLLKEHGCDLAISGVGA